MELGIPELSSSLLVLVILASSSNASNGKSFLQFFFFFSFRLHFSHMQHIAVCFFFRPFITAALISNIFFLSLQFKSLMLVVKLSAEAQIEEWLTPNLRFTNSPFLTSPTSVRIMFSKAASVGLLVLTYRHVSPLTWLHHPIS